MDDPTTTAQVIRDALQEQAQVQQWRDARRVASSQHPDWSLAASGRPRTRGTSDTQLIFVAPTWMKQALRDKAAPYSMSSILRSLVLGYLRGEFDPSIVE